MMHPIGGALRILFDVKLELGSFSKTVHANAARVKDRVYQYVQDRKSGKFESKMNGYDILSVILQD